MPMLTRRLILALPLLAAACGDDEAAPQTFAPPNYSYLTPIRLTIASVEIDDRSVSEPGAIEGLSPVRPADALKQMANDRLVASGNAGRAVFVIDRASIVRAGGGLTGAMAVHLDMFSGAGESRSAYAEAKVTRRRTGDSAESNAAALYDLTTKMMADMNVEFEFQVTHTLRDWVQATTRSLPPPGVVQHEDLGAPTRPGVAR